MRQSTANRVPRKPCSTLDSGLGGPGRFLVDQFGCSVVGVDLLPLRIDLAQVLTDLTKIRERISYRVADATNLGLEDGSFAQVWMLDVSMHIRDKQALFGEIARVLRPDGLLVMHEQMGPLPKAMLPVRRRAPYIAPSFPQLIRYVEGAGLRVLTWRDTTDIVLDYFVRMRALLGDRSEVVPAVSGPSTNATSASRCSMATSRPWRTSVGAPAFSSRSACHEPSAHEHRLRSLKMEQVIRYDNEVAATYSAMLGDTVEDPGTAALLDLLGEVSGMRVLDLPCGEGRVARELARRGPTSSASI